MPARRPRRSATSVIDAPAIKPLTMAAYRAACSVRHPAFVPELVRFHQRWPMVFVRGRHGRPAEELTRKFRDARSPSFLVERHGAFFTPPATRQDLASLNWFSRVFTHRHWRRLAPGSRAYVQALGPQPSGNYRRDRAAFLARWPHVGAACLDYPELVSWNLRVGVPEIQSVTARTRPPAGAVGAIWIFPGMTGADLARLGPALRVFHAGPRRVHPDVLLRRLAAWDLYQQHQNMARVAQALRWRRTTAWGLYLAARRDVDAAASGAAWGAGSHDQHQGAPAHVATCATCQRATRVEDLCPVARAHATQDQRSGRRVIG